MLQTLFVSNCIEKCIDDIKIASLYFDKVIIKNRTLYAVKPENEGAVLKVGDIGIVTKIMSTVSERFLGHISTLIDEGIVDVVDECDERKEPIWKNIDEVVYKILSEKMDILFELKDKKGDATGNKTALIKLSDEVKDVHSEFLNPIEVGSEIHLNFVLKYYSSLLSSLFKNVSTGLNCITASEALNRFIMFYCSNEKIKKMQRELAKKYSVAPQLAFEAIKISVPNITAFPFDEVLEIRGKSKDELLRFRNEMEAIQFDFQNNFDIDYISAHSEDFVKYKIKPAVDDLAKKINTLNLRLPLNILEKIKEPASYTPLVGTLFNAIPAHIAILLSFGIISISTAYDYVLSKKEIKDNGLFYLIKLNNFFDR